MVVQTPACRNTKEGMLPPGKKGAQGPALQRGNPRGWRGGGEVKGYEVANQPLFTSLMPRATAILFLLDGLVGHGGGK